MQNSERRKLRTAKGKEHRLGKKGRKIIKTREQNKKESKRNKKKKGTTRS